MACNSCVGSMIAMDNIQINQKPHDTRPTTRGDDDKKKGLGGARKVSECPQWTTTAIKRVIS